MPMMFCQECNKEISNQADACPHCGAKPSLGKIGKYIAAFFVVASIVGMVASPPQKKEQAPAEAVEIKANNFRFSLAKAMAKDIKAALRDPDSLKFDMLIVNGDATIACAT